jgi:hypothetical protein
MNIAFAGRIHGARFFTAHPPYEDGVHDLPSAITSQSGYGCVDDANIKPAFDILTDVIQKYL